MPFGRHRGEDLARVARRYLKWCLDELDDLRPDLREAIERVLAGEGEGDPPPAIQRSHSAGSSR
jgi:hypothetical protein